MPATAANLRELHQLHQRAKTLRDRLMSAPKTLAARDIALANRAAALDAQRKALQDAKVQQKKKEHSVQGLNGKLDDLRGKLNQVKKNEEYKAIQNQIAHDQAAIEKYEGEILEDMMRIDELAAAISKQEAEHKAFAAEVAAMRNQVESQAAESEAQLRELDAAIADAESIIPEDMRERYRRTIKQHGAEALAAVDYDIKIKIGSCLGCFSSLTTQTINELINHHSLVFCQSCGRVLYLPEEEVSLTRRK
jgi:predicted  nucleic acid-binding Zn-ribbon protein